MTPFTDTVKRMLATNLMAFNPMAATSVFGGGEDPKQVAANNEAIRFGIAHGMTSPPITGAKGIPKYIDSATGKPYVPLPGRKKLQMLPAGVSKNDIINADGKYFFTDPKSGDAIEVDPLVFNKK